MREGYIKVHCPATVANMVCGFDILGFALEEPNDIMYVRLIDEPKVIIRNLDDYGLPTDPEKNVAGVVFLEIIQQQGNKFGFEVEIDKNIKPGSGLGSSAASAAGAAVAANHLLNNPFDTNQLIQFAMLGEKLACGVKHADNITPCIMGGVTLVRSIHPLDIVRLNAPEMYAAVVHPQIEVKTSDARQILRKEVLLKDAIRQWGNIAGLVAGLEQGNYDLISRSLEDVIVEPVRSILIPGFDEVKLKSKEAGALGGGISGSGPSLFMLCKEKSTAIQVEKAMQDVFTGLGIEYRSYVGKLSPQGVTCTEA
jgi:homoserine kinase